MTEPMTNDEASDRLRKLWALNAGRPLHEYICEALCIAIGAMEDIKRITAERDKYKSALSVAAGNIVNIRYGLMVGDTKAKCAIYLDEAHHRILQTLNAH